MRNEQIKYYAKKFAMAGAVGLVGLAGVVIKYVMKKR